VVLREAKFIIVLAATKLIEAAIVSVVLSIASKFILCTERVSSKTKKDKL
jgi:hypothetical protein